MNLPGFTAEAGAYKTNNHYRLAAGGNFSGDGTASVVPQDCGWRDVPPVCELDRTFGAAVSSA